MKPSVADVLSNAHYNKTLQFWSYWHERLFKALSLHDLLIEMCDNNALNEQYPKAF
jgi:hypothetical protein